MNQPHPEYTTFSQALTKQQVEIKSWDDFQSHLAFYGGNHRYKWCFRGQANAAWNLVPSLERFIPDRRRENTWRVEQVLLNRFRRQAHQYIDRIPADTDLVEWFALMQHWSLPTRMLDFTLSPYVALYFALRESMSSCEKCGPTHAAVWAICHVALQNIAKGELGLAKAKAKEFRRAFDELLSSPSESRVVAPLQPSLMNERLAAQQGLFLCPASVTLPFDILISQPVGFRSFVDAEKRKVKESFAHKLIIPLDQRTQILRELNRMNISASSLFPGLDGFVRSIRRTTKCLDQRFHFISRLLSIR